MGVTAANIEVGTELAPLVKHMTLQKMTWFSGGEGRAEKQNLHTDAAAAERDTGMKQPFASGRMSMGYASELMSRFVGLDPFSRSGTLDFKFIKPVMPGDTMDMFVEVLFQRRNIFKFRGRVEVRGQLATDCEFAAMKADRPQDSLNES